MAKLSAFGDEAVDDFLGQVKFLAGEKVSFIEPRFLNKKNIIDLSKDELKQARKILRDYGLKVSAIGSPIGKVKLDEPFGPHLDKFKHAAELAFFFESPFIRVFSYYAPVGGDINKFRSLVMERMFAQLEVIKDLDVMLVHENETDIYGQTAENCVDLAKTLNSPKFRLVYDPANFVWGQKIKNNVETCWPLMKPYVVHIHIKDWKLGADTGSMPGQGDGQIKELLAELAEMKYGGCMTMEPHLKVGGQFGGSTGTELFSKAIAAVRELSAQVGLECD